MSDRPGMARIIPRASANGVLVAKTADYPRHKFGSPVCQWHSRITGARNEDFRILVKEHELENGL